ncbi:ATP-dependent DNA helicase [Oceanobacillus halophilus]|nr:ATP-binding domain-containing protein [Oceanobacillus halophilus]
MQNLLIKEEIPSAVRFKPTGFENGQYTFYLGDREIQLKNNVEKSVLNGDLGIVVGVLPAEEQIRINEETQEEEIVEEPERLIVRFDKKEILYYKEEMNELALAYCFSVHKTQGSEFPHVLLPISSAHRFMMNRNLLYTAITRAKKEITIIGELEVFLQGLKENLGQSPATLTL